MSEPLAEQDGIDIAENRRSRRSLLKTLAGLGIGSLVFQRAVAARAAEGPVTAEMLRQAAWIAGIELKENEQQEIAKAVERDRQKFEVLRNVPVGYDVPPAVVFHAAPPQDGAGAGRGEVRFEPKAAAKRPDKDDDLAFLPVTELAALVKSKQISSLELTKLYLDRLKRFDPLLKCVVTLTEETALEQAKRADSEIAAGKYRGPLHGIPWGAKDIIAWPGYKTTWGAGVFQDQTVETKATVAARLEEAGAVLVAKLTVGALALGDEWFGGMTRNPWNPEEGSSGSSAGSTSAVVAGLVGFAIGSETLGSIVSPCRRCSASGLRPTFGRVSRHGCMALSWTMDKIGPICRSIEDCALVFGAIHGAGGDDQTAVDRPFDWPTRRHLASLKVGYFEAGAPVDERPETAVLRKLGVTLVPIKLPDHYPAGALTLILNTEAAAAFDELTRMGIRDGIGHWASTFVKGQFVPAIEYLRANRIRTLLMREMEKAIAGVDAYVGGDDLVITNLTGHPTAIVPFGNRQDGKNGQPGTMTFTGRLFGESDLLALAHAFQEAGSDHQRHPPVDRLLMETAGSRQ
jgi:Asp-tRNA(Asn)/Glu-tRNA(Gln) amidotransferase A subunit family amidase